MSLEQSLYNEILNYSKKRQIHYYSFNRMIDNILLNPGNEQNLVKWHTS